MEKLANEWISNQQLNLRNDAKKRTSTASKKNAMENANSLKATRRKYENIHEQHWMKCFQSSYFSFHLLSYSSDKKIHCKRLLILIPRNAVDVHRLRVFIEISLVD